MDIFKLYLPLCWFKNNPLQLPHSMLFFQINLAAFFSIQFLTQANMIPPFEAFSEVCADVILTLLFVTIVLALNKTMHCFIPLASAILVTDNIVSLFGVPVIAWLAVSHDWLSYVLLAVLMFWDFCIITYIMKRVLAIDIYASLVVALFYFFVTFGLAYVIAVAF